MKERLKKLASFKTLLILGIIFCICCLLPPVRASIISIVELLLGRSLRNVSKWDSVLIHSMNMFITIQLFWLYFGYTVSGHITAATIGNRTMTAFHTPDTKKHLLILLIIFAVSFFAIIHANYENADDIRRMYAGQRAWAGYSRFVSEYLSIFVHTNFFINDITPLTQIWAILALTAASYILAYIVTDGHITGVSLTAASFIGISPFFLSCFAYKYDCPYMALAVLFGILPFLYIKSRKSYILTSFICLVLVCTSYQAANSIYIVLAIFSAYKMWLQKKSAREITVFAAVSVCCYIAALVFFRIFLMSVKTGTEISRGTGVATGSGLFAIFSENLVTYVHTVFSEFGNSWIRLFAVIVVCLFPAAGVMQSKRNKVGTFFFTIAVLALMFLLSFGAYLVLEQPLFSWRTFMGFSVLIAVLALFDLSAIRSGTIIRKIAVVSVCALFYGFVVFAAVYGNVLNKQKAYENFRFTILLQDLNHIVNQNADNSFYIGGITGPAGKIRIDQKNYPIVTGVISPVLTHYLLKDYNMYFKVLSEDTLEELDPETKKQLTDLPLILDTYYHTIYGKDNQYYIYLKNIPEKKYN